MKEPNSASGEYFGKHSTILGGEFKSNGAKKAGSESVSESWMTCPRCGYPLGRSINESQVMYCPQCGARIGGGPTGAWIRPPARKSSHHVRNIILIILGALFATTILSVLITGSKHGTQDSPSSSSGPGAVSQKIPYTKGEFDGIVYHNDWADMIFYLPEGFKNASEDYYSMIEIADTVDCGLYLISDDGGEIIIGFEKIFNSLITENIYLDSVLQNMRSSAEEQGFVVEHTEYRSFFIGTQEYTAADVKISNELMSIIRNVYVRKIDDRMCAIQIEGTDSNSNDRFAESLGTFSHEGAAILSDSEDPLRSKAAYTKGTLAGNLYANEWADLQFILPEGFNNASEEEYAAQETLEGGECGLMATDGTGAACMVLFMDCPYQVTEETLALVVKATAEQFTEEGYSAQWNGQQEDVQIAGNAYSGAHISVDVGGIIVVQSLYQFQIDNKLCEILITGPNKEANNALAEQFTPCGEY